MQQLYFSNKKLFHIKYEPPHPRSLSLIVSSKHKEKVSHLLLPASIIPISKFEDNRFRSPF